MRKKTPESDKKDVMDILAKFVHPESGFVSYRRVEKEAPELWNRLVIVPKRSHHQLQQLISRVRRENGKGLYKIKNHKVVPNIKTAKSPPPVPRLEIKTKYEMNLCPNCGCNLKNGKVGINMPYEHE